VRFAELLWPFANLPHSYISLDTETTGLPDERGMPDIISLGLSDVHEREIVSNLECKMRPGRQISGEAQRVHGISSEQADEFEDLGSQWPTISARLSGRLVVIHNANFDWPILVDQLGRSDLPLPNVTGVFCSQKSAFPWALANGLECSDRGPSLDMLTSVLGVESLRTKRGGIHGAAIDSHQAALVVERLREEFYRR